MLSLVRAEMRAKLFRGKPPGRLCLGARAALCVGKFGVCFSPRWNRESRGVPWVPCLAPRTEHPLGTHTQQIISSRGKKTQQPFAPHQLLHIWAPSLQSGLSKRAARDCAVFHPKEQGKHRFEGRGGRDSRASTFSLATNLLPASLCLAAPWD